MKENNKLPAPTKSKTNERKLTTLEDIRDIKGHEHLSDVEAQRILDSIRQFVSLMVDFMQKNYGHE